MKSAYIMGTLLLLTACAGGNGGGGASTPGGVRAPTAVDLPTTSMQDSADNKSNIIAYAMDKIGNTPSVTNAGGTSSAQSRNGAIRTISATNNGFNFEDAITEYQNMYDFATDNTDGKDDKDLKKAFLLSGGDADDYDNLSDDARKQFIKDNHEQVLRRFFDWDDENHKPKNWNHKTSNLADMKLQQIGSRDWDEDYIRITQTKNGKIESIALKDGWFNTEFNFERKSNNKYNGYLAKYRIPYLNSDGDRNWLKIETHKKNLNEQQIKDLFRDTLNAPNAKEIFDLSDENLALAQSAVNDLTTDGMIYLSQTEWEKLEERQNVIYLIQSDMDVSIQAYGQETGLKFSDFGTISGTDKTGGASGAKPQEVGYVFAGGYDVKEIDKNIIDDKMEFAGNAIGKVMYFDESETGVATKEFLDIAAAANLIFDNGKETLTANFSENKTAANRWYDVVVEFDGTDADLTLKNGDAITENNAKFKFDGVDTDGTFENIIAGSPPQTDETGKGNATFGNFTSTYYGDGIAPTEAVGTVSFVQQEWKQDPNTYKEEYNREINFMAGFGVVKK
ncbi:MAG: hypothetical protein IJD52_02415 [Alphaproteobacteria bacterium]|nr:hypothetical protein [Alphaproteobacteria bacterium]